MKQNIKRPTSKAILMGNICVLTYIKWNKWNIQLLFDHSDIKPTLISVDINKYEKSYTNICLYV